MIRDGKLTLCGIGICFIAAALAGAAGCAGDEPEAGAPLPTDAGSGQDTTVNEDASTPADVDTPPDVSTPDASTDGGALADAAPDVDPVPDTGQADAGDTNPADTGPEPLPACDPPLTLETDVPIVGTLAYRTLMAGGGTGGYRFELIQTDSDGLVNELTGAYLSGAIGETIDIVRLTDTACQGAVELALEVVSDPIIKPGDITVGLTQCLQLAVSLGSGEFSFELLSGAPVGTLTDQGFYTAGDEVGQDVIRVTDLITGRDGDVLVSVADGVALHTTSDTIAIPLGGTFVLMVADGSGSVDTVITGDAVSAEDDLLLADSEGTSSLAITDQFLECAGPDGQSFAQVELPVAVVAALQPPLMPFADAGNARVRGPGDLDGDGYPDAVFGLIDSFVGGKNAGAILVFAGTETGLAPEPAQVLTASKRDSDFGVDFELVDTDGDGELDLLVGAWGEDTTGGNRGAVYRYPGVPGGFFAEEPSQIWRGLKNGDLLGSSVAACDFDGDGDIDLALAAEGAEDTTQEPTASDQGAVFIYLQDADGIPEEPSLTRWGQIPADNGTWVGIKSMRMGVDMAAGDFDGDGQCDLAVGIRDLQTVGNKKDDGAVLLYRGTDEGISALPARAWAPLDPANPNSLYGFRLELGDVTGDGAADLVVAQRRYFDGGSNRGAVRMYVGGPLPDSPPLAVEAAEDSDWHVTAAANSDELGTDLALADVDGDGDLDVLVSGLGDEAPFLPSGTGAVSWYQGRAPGLPDDTASAMLGGALAGDQFGRAFAPIGDLNSDGVSELAVWASHNDEDGTNVGRGYTVWGQPESQIAFGEEWSWSVPATDPGTEWLAADFDTAAWPSGPAPIGWGDDQPTQYTSDADNPTAVLFRKTITLDADAAWTQLRVVYNDAVAVWVNGELVLVERMEDPPVFEGYATQASGNNQSAGAAFDGLLVAGDNVIAAMIKPQNAGDGKATFDLQLTAHATTLNQESPLQVLQPPIASALSRYGNDVTIVPDITGDGHEDLLVGAREATPMGAGVRSGTVFVHAGTAAGSFEPVPASELAGWPLHVANAQVGQAMAWAGDFDGNGQADLAIAARNIDQKNDSEGHVIPEACNQNRNDTGAVFIVPPGVGGGAGPVANFVIYGPQTSQRVERVIGGFDFNGDGKKDVALGSGTWDRSGASNAGGIGIVLGRAQDPAGVSVICEYDTFLLGHKKDDNMGWGMTSLGDLNDDGCDDLAVGAYLEDLGNSNQGTVRVLFGAGPGCAWTTPRVLLLAPKTNNTNFGISLAGGHDLTGDGVSDLLVGGSDFRVGSLRLGAAWVISGAWILDQIGQAKALVAGELPSDETIVDTGPSGNAPDWIGTTHSGRFGHNVALAPGVGPAEAAAVVGEYLGAVGGATQAGGAFVFDHGSTYPRLTLSGESWRPNSQLGVRVAAGQVNGKPVAVIAGPLGSAVDQPLRVDDGSVYVVSLVGAPNSP